MFYLVQMAKTLVINLYGGPGTGKSTSAALLYATLKSMGVNAELVREYVKDWAWEGRTIGTYDQLYFMGKQIRKESSLYGKVEVIVTDSPVWMSAYYAAKYSPLPVAQGVTAAVKGYYAQAGADGHKHVHVFLTRSKLYNQSGRYQTEAEALEMDTELKAVLATNFVETTQCGTENADLETLLEYLLGTP